MKTSSRPPSPSPRKVGPVWIWVAINQLAFPGLGTIIMGRRIGYVQASIMVAGFILVVGFIGWYVVCGIRYWQRPAWSEADFADQYRPYQWALFVGLGLCAVAWVWSLFSSISILRQTRSGSEH